MATPSVAGIAALLMDAVPDHANDPALARARLMASAVRPDAWLDAGPAFPATNTDGPGALNARYGLGKVSARTAVLRRDVPDGWTTGAAVATLADGEYGAVEIEVPEGASRLDVVMTWDEPPAETIADPVLNDLDLWLDRGADCGAGACGEFSSRSGIDNVEWIVVRDPPTGVWRVKVTAPRVYTAPPRAAVAWTVIRGRSTPRLGVDAAARTAGPGRTDLVAVVSTDGYVAAGTRLGLGCRAAVGSEACLSVRIESAAVVREDGVETALLDEISLSGLFATRAGTAVPVGEVAAGAPRTVRLAVSHPPDDGILLVLRASAWNALGGSAGVAAGGRADAPEMPPPPPNDAFGDATVLDGVSGTETVDLLLATPDPGGPAFGGSSHWAGGPPAGSAWFVWTAPRDGLAGFAVEAEGDSSAHWIDVYRGDAVAALESVASGTGDLLFLAEKDVVYRVRVSHTEAGRLATLRWRPGERPAHDDFAAAAELEGESGSFGSSNAGATLEPGEWFGGTVATTWHRWTAPADGWWTFEREGRANVAVFEGDGVADARLVSGFEPGRSTARFPAAAGRAYRIVVGGTDAFAPVGPYKLGWRRGGSGDGNDEIGFAEPLGDVSSGESLLFAARPSDTVSPGEPPETGVRTAWWAWEAPSAGRWTWRASEDADAAVSVFFGPSADELSLAGRIAPRAADRAVAVAVEAGQRLWISAGFAARGRSAFARGAAEPVLSWGPTPANDDRGRAAALSGFSGAVAGTNVYATTAPGDQALLLGRSTLWWTWEPEESGWVRFEAAGEGGPWAVAVHEGDAIRAASRWQVREGDGAAVLLHAEAGKRYAISLGVLGGGSGGDFTLRRDAADPPVWLRYAGRLADGDREADGASVEIRGPGELAFGDGALYLASRIGLQVFERDAANGTLTAAQLLDGDLERASIAWDGSRGRLLAHDCGSWRSYARAGAGPELAEETLRAADAAAGCGRLLVHPDADFVYRIRGDAVDVFAVGADGGLDLASTRNVGLAMGASLRDDGLLHVADGQVLLALRTDAETGELTASSVPAPLMGPTERAAMAVTDDLLFVVDATHAHVYTLADALAPARLAMLAIPARGEGWLLDDWCSLAADRGAAAADVFCPGRAFAVRYHPDRVALAETDRVDDGQADRWDNPLPAIGRPTGMAASPDGRHVYVATGTHGILVFERVAPVPAQAATPTPDLSVASVSVDPADAAVGSTMALSATVWNVGDAASEETALRFYVSADAAIAANDDEVGSVPVPVLAASESADLSAQAAVPGASGTWWYGACVDAAADEFRTLNNCSPGAAVTVTGGARGADDHGDTFAAATDVAVPSATGGSLEAEDDRDVFRLVLDASAALTVETTGTTDTYGTLFDAGGDRAATDDDGGAQTNFRIERDVPAGTYFIEVQGFHSSVTGDYELNVRSAAGGD